MAETRLFGYAEPFTARAGGRVEFMISAEGSDLAEAQLVRLIHGDENPIGPGFVEEEVASAVNGQIAVRRQFTQLGAFCDANDPKGLLNKLSSFTLFAHVQPTLLKSERQAIMGQWDVVTSTGYALGLDPEGKVSLWIGDGKKVDKIKTELNLIPRCWYFVAASYDAASGNAELHVINCVNKWNSRISTVVPFELDQWVTEKLSVKPAPTPAEVPFKLAGASESNANRGRFTSLLFNGKLDRSGVYDRVLGRAEVEALSRSEAPAAQGLVAYWDPTVNITADGVGDEILDTGPNGLHLMGVNRPVRLMTGVTWVGADSFHLAKDQFAGVHFHDDALIDCKWQATCALDLPDELRSGVYALRLRAGGREDHVTFMVSPKTPQARMAVLMPTFTYLAYANEHLAYEANIAQGITAHTPVLSVADLEYKKLEEFGLSTYDHHSDGSGCCFSSWSRPVLSFRPKFRISSTNLAWALPADLSLIWWLEHAGYDYDVITDHDLDRDGVAALKPYQVVLNCTHPEYYSLDMLDGTEDYLRDGGRLMYMGGNGYYWVTAVRKSAPNCIEVRKLDTGSRAWQAEPGEGHLTTTGERSGLWRSRGRAPQKIVGLGFSSEGFDQSSSFERMPDSFHKRVSWIMQGIGDEEEIGDFGLGAGGAAGVELDRYDLTLGTPPHTALLASSWGHSDNYPLVSEEVTYAFPGRGGTQDYQVRGDMIYFTTPKNGAVFASGSIAWSQALPCKGGENNVARVTKTVLDAFLKPGALPGSEFKGDEKLWR